MNLIPHLAEAARGVDALVAAAVTGSSFLPWIATHRAAVVLILSILAAAFAAGGVVTMWANAQLSLPARVMAIEHRQATTDSIAAARWIVVERLVCQLREEQTGRIPPECDRRIIR